MGTFVSIVPTASAEEEITILPDSKEKTRPRFLDITFYPIEKGKELTWFNDSNMNQRIIINKIQIFTTEKKIAHKT
jgi:hypothetical protein